MSEPLSDYQRACLELAAQREAILEIARFLKCTYGEALVRFQVYVRNHPDDWRTCYAHLKTLANQGAELDRLL